MAYPVVAPAAAAAAVMVVKTQGPLLPEYSGEVTVSYNTEQQLLRGCCLKLKSQQNYRPYLLTITFLLPVHCECADSLTLS